MESMKTQYLKSGSGRKKDKERKKKRWFFENGGILLEELISDSNGKSIPIRSFPSDQILKATNNFDSSCFVSEDAYYKWYKGDIEDRSYMIKKFSEDKITGHRIKEVYNDIVLSARMSNHNNFLKLLGCSLEFPFPVLVFEFASNGVLNERGGISVNGEDSLLPWGLRLKIGKEIANAVTYLHMAFPKIIIHRDVKPMHVFLDKNWTVKLSDLSFSISLPEGKTRIEAERIIGTFGYLDPQGILSYVKGLWENGKVDEVIDPMIAKDIMSVQKSQVEMCVVLALRCCNEYRPKMIQVAKELKLIEALVLSDFS